MSRAFILDFNKLSEKDLTVEEFLALARLEDVEYDHQISSEILDSLERKYYIKIVRDKIQDIVVLRFSGKMILELFDLNNFVKTAEIVKKELPIKGTDDISQFVTELRLLWKGLKTGSMGDEVACKKKLIRWMEEHPQYSKEQILNAAKVYLNSVDDYRFLQRADYFIYKREGIDEISRLSIFIEEHEAPSSDWTTNLS